MKSKEQITEPDFQKLVALVLNDLALRRTMLENREQEVNQQLSSLERDAELEQLDEEVSLWLQKNQVRFMTIKN